MTKTGTRTRTALYRQARVQRNGHVRSNLFLWGVEGERRNMYRRVMPVLVVLLLAIPASAAASNGRVGLEDLRVERKTEPVGIDVQRPRFSWVVESRERGTEQRSYRLRVTQAGREVWDSGTVRSDASSDVEYRGPALESATRYDWRVDVKTNAGDASERSSFRTGLSAAADWAGSTWIGNARSSAVPAHLRRRLVDLDARGRAAGGARRAARLPARRRGRRLGGDHHHRRRFLPAVGQRPPDRRDGRRRERVAAGAPLPDRARSGAQRLRRAHDQRRRLARRAGGQAPHPPRRRHRGDRQHRHELEGGQDVPGGLLAPGLRRLGLGRRGRAGRVRQRPVGRQRARPA